MLRISIKKTRKTLTFQLEGTLAGAWLRELEQCWSSTMTRERKSIVRVDLAGVTFIDTPGKAVLATMHREGAEFIAHDCMTKDVVREICEDRSRAVAPKSST
jgi:ABC-type transporter Mla MlaB component